MNQLLRIAVFLLNRTSVPFRITAGFVTIPSVRRNTVRTARFLLRRTINVTSVVSRPFINIGRNLLRAPREPLALPASRELMSHPIHLWDISWILQPEVLTGIFVTYKLLKLAYGFLRGRKTTFTPSESFVKFVRRIVDQPWDIILVLFQMGASTVIVYGIIAVVVKFIKDFNDKTLVLPSKPQNIFENKGNHPKDSNNKQQKPRK